jgi:hypothetical protein
MKPSDHPTSAEAQAAHESRRRSIGWMAGIAIAAAVCAVGGLGLLMNVMERKQEGRNPFFRVVELTDDTEDPAVWGKNFPMQYDDYLTDVGPAADAVWGQRGDAEDAVGCGSAVDGGAVAVGGG